MAKKARNRYQALIEKIFFDHYSTGATSLDFTRQEIKDAATTLGIVRECLILCVSERAHAVFRYVQASKRPANIMAS
jgi:hypothetical protein